MRYLALFFALAACGGASSSPSDAGNTPDGATQAAQLLAFFDLPREADTHALSGAYFDVNAGTLYAIQDSDPNIVPILASADFRSWSVSVPIPLVGRPGSDWDGEGLARGTDGVWFAVTVETQPLIERYTSTGTYLGAVPTPARFALQPPGNMGVESLSISPSGTYLFFANEGALTTDGPIATKSSGTRIRILRRNLATDKDEEHAYLTEPCGDGDGGTLGVSDVTAISDNTVLVLERGFQSGYGNTVRIYEADVSSSPDVSTIGALDTSAPTLTKKLILDLATLPTDGVPVGETQPNPILDNYEGLALGPLLPDGRRIVFVISDDNARASQVARILVLALTL